MGEQLRSKVRCKTCGSSDGATVYQADDGKTFLKCFAGCGGKQYWLGGGDEDPDNMALDEALAELELWDLAVTPQAATKPAPAPRGTDDKSLAQRGVTGEALKKYRVRDEGNGAMSFPYGTVATKVRLPGKEIRWEGAPKDSPALWGMDLFQPGGKTVCITEGEPDALSAYAMLGHQWPVVSLKNGAASAEKDCKLAYDWLNTFEQIILSFDADKPGQEAAQKVAEMFAGKSCVMQMDAELKDANGYVQAKKTKDWVDAYWSARKNPWRPDGVVNIADMWAEIEEPVEQPIIEWAEPEIQQMTDGMFGGTMVGLVAGTGIGKSTKAREVIKHAMGKGVKCGALFLEEGRKVTAKRQLGMWIGKQIWRKDVEVSREELQQAFAEMSKDGLLEIYSHLGLTDPDAILGKVRYMAKALGCRIIVLDHISIIVSGMESDNERKDIDLLMTKLRSLVEETGICLLYISHLKRPDGTPHEEGGRITLGHLRGSGAIAQLSDVIIAGERNQQSDDVDARTTTLWRVLKNRWTGDVGPATLTRYNKVTGLNEYVGPAESLPKPEDNAL